MYHIRSRGFTLIELLVVIAIIGILSAVVLASLSTARSKGSDAAIQSDLTGAQTQAEIFYGAATTDTPAGGGNSYTNLCTSAQFAKQTAAADTANGSSGGVFCNVTTGTGAGTAYAAGAQLVADTAKYWCVDSTGASKSLTGTALGSAVTACP